MNIKDIKGRQFNLEHLDANPIYIEMPARAFSISYENRFPCYEFTCCYMENGQADWMTQKSDIERIALSLIKSEQEDPGLFAQNYSEWKDRYERVMKKCELDRDKDFSALSNQEIKTGLQDLMDRFLSEMGFPPFFDAYMFYADKKLQALLSAYQKEHQTKENANVLFSIMSAPVNDSFLNEEENALMALANRQLQGEDLSEALKDHQKKYWFINSNYSGLSEYSLEVIRQKIKELIDGNRLVCKDVPMENKKAKQALLEKYEFSSETMLLVRLTEIFTKWQDDRKAVTLTYIGLMTKYVTEIARRTNLPYRDLVFTSHEELIEAVDGHVDLNLLQQRRTQPFLRLYQGGKIVESICGEEAKAFREQSVQLLDEGLTEARGFAASLGKAYGRVKVVMSNEDAKKVEKGDVLVIPMTRPEHVPYMKLASAIVTDDGGITCHAAIVSRELGKPCVIGTKIATQIFKDGDMVEVNANHGIVRKI